MRALWITLGVTSLGLGIIGIVLPILPTTPFVLLSAFAFSRSSPRLHAALLAHRTFGPLILQWQTERAIPRRAKIMAVTMMTLVFLGSLLAGVSERVLLIQGIAMGGAADNREAPVCAWYAGTATRTSPSTPAQAPSRKSPTNKRPLRMQIMIIFRLTVQATILRLQPGVMEYQRNPPMEKS